MLVTRILLAVLAIALFAPLAKGQSVESAPVFDRNFYLSKHKDVARAGVDPLQHWKNHGIKEGRASSPVFDVKWYLNNNADLLRTFGANNYKAAVEHFIIHGIREGRQANSSFNVKFYKETYADLQRAFGGNMIEYYNHYINHGMRENRKTLKSQIGKTTAANNALRYGSKITLLSHHGKYLVAEGDGSLNANRAEARSQEQFTILNASNMSDRGVVRFGDKVFLRSFNNKYVVGEHDGTANANRDRAASLETFYILDVSNQGARGMVDKKSKTVCFKTLHNKYLVAEPDGRANADRTEARRFETWSLNAPPRASNPTPPTASNNSSNAPGSSPVYLKVSDASLYVHAEGGSSAGALETLHPCPKNMYFPNCQWIFEKSPTNPNAYYIKSSGGYYLHAQGGANAGAQMTLHPCPKDKNYPNCQWVIEKSPSKPGFSYIKSLGANLYLHASGGSNSGAKLTLHACPKGNNHPNCQFKMEEAPKSNGKYSTVVLKRIKCLRPATGIELGVNQGISDGATAAGLGLAVVGVGATLASGPAAPAVAAGATIAGAVAAGASFGTWIAGKIDANRSPDQLYIKINGRKVWPGGKYTEMRTNQEREVNLVMGRIPGRHSLEFFEYDTMSGDDSFGVFYLNVDNDAQDKYFSIIYECKKEDSSYLLTFELR